MTRVLVVAGVTARTRTGVLLPVMGGGVGAMCGRLPVVGGRVPVVGGRVPVVGGLLAVLGAAVGRSIDARLWRPVSTVVARLVVVMVVVHTPGEYYMTWRELATG